MIELVRTGVLRGLSVEFAALAETMEGNVRVISRARLGAIAVVDEPAYPASEVEARMKLAAPSRRRVVYL